jgi:uncharacterized membrane protein
MTVGDVLAVVRVGALAVGVAAAAAALYGRYAILPAFLTGPKVCKLDAGGCQVLFRTRAAALLGVPNAALGLLLYTLLAVGLAAGWSHLWMLLAATPALLMSLHLARLLLANHLECRICWAGHAANALLWTTFLVEVLA